MVQECWQREGKTSNTGNTGICTLTIVTLTIPGSRMAGVFDQGSLDLGAMSSPKRIEWVEITLDTRAAVITLSFNFDPGRAGDGIFYRTASVECIPDGGAWQFQDHDENGLSRSLKCSAVWEKCVYRT